MNQVILCAPRCSDADCLLGCADGTTFAEIQKWDREYACANATDFIKLEGNGSFSAPYHFGNHRATGFETAVASSLLEERAGASFLAGAGTASGGTAGNQSDISQHSSDPGVLKARIALTMIVLKQDLQNRSTNKSTNKSEHGSISC